MPSAWICHPTPTQKASKLLLISEALVPFLWPPANLPPHLLVRHRMLTHWRTSQITQTRAHESLLFSMYCWIKKTYPQQTFNKIYYTSLPRFPSLHSCSLHQFFLATDGQKKTHTLWLFQMLSYLCHCLSSPPFKHLSTLFFPQTLRLLWFFRQGCSWRTHHHWGQAPIPLCIVDPIPAQHGPRMT